MKNNLEEYVSELELKIDKLNDIIDRLNSNMEMRLSILENQLERLKTLEGYGSVSRRRKYNLIRRPRNLGKVVGSHH